MPDTETEGKIGQFFDAESREMFDRHEKEGIPPSMEFMVDTIMTNNPEVVLDIGSGPGSLMLQFLKQGVDKVIGVDLSDDMVKLAAKRLSDEGYEENITLLKKSLLDLQIEDNIDAITLHRVLCCHPEREKMIIKTTSFQPQTISITIPRTWWFMRLFVGIYGVVSRIRNSFRPYIHSQQEINQQMHELGYEITSASRDFFWITTTYERSIEDKYDKHSN